MFSLNKWVVKGKVMDVIKNQRGYWITVKGIAKNPSAFDSDCFRIKCWISKRVLGDKKIKKQISLTGSFLFINMDCYLVADSVD